MKKLAVIVFISIVCFADAVEYERTTIGHSVKRRPIVVYKFGEGKQFVVLVAGVHGNEGNSMETAYYLINRLITGEIAVPKEKTVFIIPEANPDGLLIKTRLNSNQVDINRNFPTKHWAPTFLYQGQRLSAGEYPLSEPESRCLKDFIEGLIFNKHNMVVLTLHSRGNAIIEGSTADYNDRLVRFLRENSPYKTILDYPTFGDFEKWLSQAHGIASATIEFRTKTDPDNEINERILKVFLTTDIYNEFYATVAK